MSGYDFSRFTCLVVEDSTFIRSLIISCLNAMGVSQVKVANHGGEAIDWLKLMKTDPMKAGILSIDLIISELKEYCNDLDPDFVRKSVRAIGIVAVKVERCAKRAVEILQELVKQEGADTAL